jgi:hypothetical protein
MLEKICKGRRARTDRKEAAPEYQPDEVLCVRVQGRLEGRPRPRQQVKRNGGEEEASEQGGKPTHISAPGGRLIMDARGQQ